MKDKDGGFHARLNVAECLLKRKSEYQTPSRQRLSDLCPTLSAMIVATYTKTLAEAGRLCLLWNSVLPYGDDTVVLEYQDYARLLDLCGRLSGQEGGR